MFVVKHYEASRFINDQCTLIDNTQVTSSANHGQFSLHSFFTVNVGPDDVLLTINVTILADLYAAVNVREDDEVNIYRCSDLEWTSADFVGELLRVDVAEQFVPVFHHVYRKLREHVVRFIGV